MVDATVGSPRCEPHPCRGQVVHMTAWIRHLAFSAAMQHEGAVSVRAVRPRPAAASEDLGRSARWGRRPSPRHSSPSVRVVLPRLALVLSHPSTSRRLSPPLARSLWTRSKKKVFARLQEVEAGLLQQLLLLLARGGDRRRPQRERDHGRTWHAEAGGICGTRGGRRGGARGIVAPQALARRRALRCAGSLCWVVVHLCARPAAAARAPCTC